VGTRATGERFHSFFEFSQTFTSGSLGEREMLWEHELQASVSTDFTSSPKLSRVFLRLARNPEYMFSISFRKHHAEKKETTSYYSARAITTSTARASSVSPSSYTNTIFNRSAHVLS